MNVRSHSRVWSRKSIVDAMNVVPELSNDSIWMLLSMSVMSIELIHLRSRSAIFSGTNGTATLLV